jgi:acetyl esterase/lipase
MKSIVLGVLCLMTILSVKTMAQGPDQTSPQGPAPLVLWPEGAPGALGKEPQDVPTLTPYFPRPELATGAAMIVCPGGGYGGLAPYEGETYALWLNDQGIAGFVLKYRLGSSGYRHPRMLQDAARAVRLLRARAGEWKLDAKRIGIIGSSAGGHLASTLLTHFDSGDPQATDPIERLSDRPDLGVLCYAVITMGESTHGGSKRNLLGENPSPELVAEVSNELHVTHQTPPCFVWATDEDKAVPVENSLLFAQALRRAGVPFELHIYQRGAHGMGLGAKTYEPSKFHQWTRDCGIWLKEQGFGR